MNATLRLNEAIAAESAMLTEIDLQIKEEI
jgi:hypothetical protein